MTENIKEITADDERKIFLDVIMGTTNQNLHKLNCEILEKAVNEYKEKSIKDWECEE